MRSRRRVLTGAALMWLGAVHLATAQGFQDAVRGLVKDAGGLVPGAEVNRNAKLLALAALLPSFRQGA